MKPIEIFVILKIKNKGGHRDGHSDWLFDFYLLEFKLQKKQYKIKAEN